MCPRCLGKLYGASFHRRRAFLYFTRTQPGAKRKTAPEQEERRQPSAWPDALRQQCSVDTQRPKDDKGQKRGKCERNNRHIGTIGALYTASDERSQYDDDAQSKYNTHCDAALITKRMKQVAGATERCGGRRGALRGEKHPPCGKTCGGSHKR